MQTPHQTGGKVAPPPRSEGAQQPQAAADKTLPQTPGTATARFTDWAAI